MTLTCEDPVLDIVHGMVCVPASNEVGVYEFQIPTKTLTDVFGLGDVLYVTRKRRAEIVVPVDISEVDLLRQTKALPAIASHLSGKEVIKEIVVPGRLVNIVVS